MAEDRGDDSRYPGAVCLANVDASMDLLLQNRGLNEQRANATTQIRSHKDRPSLKKAQRVGLKDGKKDKKGEKSKMVVGEGLRSESRQSQVNTFPFSQRASSQREKSKAFFESLDDGERVQSSQVGSEKKEQSRSLGNRLLSLREGPSSPRSFLEKDEKEEERKTWIWNSEVQGDLEALRTLAREFSVSIRDHFRFLEPGLSVFSQVFF